MKGVEIENLFKITDHELVLKIECSKPIIACSTCKHRDISGYVGPCYDCSEFSHHQLRTLVFKK